MTFETIPAAAPSPSRARRITAGRLTGQKPALKAKEVWAIRIRLQLAKRVRDLALFNLAIDSKLRGCDLVRLRVEDIAAAGDVKARAVIIQKKTGRPVQFEITEPTRATVAELLRRTGRTGSDYLFPSRLATSAHLSTRQYARIVRSWAASIGLNPAMYARTRFDAPKPRLSIARLAICGPCNCCLGTRSSKARFDISASMSTTPWPSRSKWNSKSGAGVTGFCRSGHSRTARRQARNRRIWSLVIV